MDKSKMDPLNLKATQRKRDAEAEAAISGSQPSEKAPDNKAFFKPPMRPTPAETVKRESELAKAIRKRDEGMNEYQKAWTD